MKLETAEIWNEFHGKLFAFIQKRVKNRDVSNDILQNVFLKIHSHLSSLKSEKKLQSWIYQITRNEIIDHFRKRNFSDDLPELAQEEVDSNPLYEAVDCCLKKFINRLPDDQRIAIEKTYFERIPQKDIAAELGISYSGLKSRVQRARETLEEWIMACCCSDETTEGAKENCTC